MHVICFLCLLNFKGLKRKKDHIGTKSRFSWDKEGCIAELNNLSPSTKLNYSNLAIKFKLVDEKGKCSLCIVTSKQGIGNAITS